jgi:nicotinate dehydrogenase subunit A
MVLVAEEAAAMLLDPARRGPVSTSPVCAQPAARFTLAVLRFPGVAAVLFAREKVSGAQFRWIARKSAQYFKGIVVTTFVGSSPPGSGFFNRRQLEVIRASWSCHRYPRQLLIWRAHPTTSRMEIFKKHRRQRREDNMAQQKSLNVNGKTVRIIIDDPDMPLLYALRDNLALHGPRFGCGLAQCGACTVHIDGKAVRSCVTPLSSLNAQQKVVTLEGLGTPQRPHPVQRAFIEEQAVQCGYCINGMIMESAAFLAKSKKPTEAQVKDALANNLCRCGSHARIVKAVMRAAGA